MLVPHHLDRHRFNEAPARMRGKTRRWCGACGGVRRFNEAPARMRGKTDSPEADAARKIAASMRPPHECGGKRLLRSLASRALRGFNEAPARMRGKTFLVKKKGNESTLLQ